MRARRSEHAIAKCFLAPRKTIIWIFLTILNSQKKTCTTSKWWIIWKREIITTSLIKLDTVCPRSHDQYYIVSYYINQDFLDIQYEINVYQNIFCQWKPYIASYAFIMWTNALIHQDALFTSLAQEVSNHGFSIRWLNDSFCVYKSNQIRLRKYILYDIAAQIRPSANHLNEEPCTKNYSCYIQIGKLYLWTMNMQKRLKTTKWRKNNWIRFFFGLQC